MRPTELIHRASLFTLLTATLAAPALAASPPCPDPPLHPPTYALLQPPRPCPGESVRILFATCAPCWDIVDVSQGTDGITVRTEQRPSECIPAVCLPESASVALGAFAVGHHTVAVRFVTEVQSADSAGSGFRCTFTHLDTLAFDVAATCARDTLPYVKDVLIGAPSPCATCPPEICAGDSIPVRIRGEFPDNCIELLGVELIPDLSMGPFPRPPLVRIAYGINECLGRPCILVPVPWTAKVKLPPLPALAGRPYSLQVETVERRFQCGPPPDTSVTGEARFPFVVSATCSTRFEHCFLTSFETTSDSIRNRCDAFVGPDRPGSATFRIGSGVPLHGLEGRFVFSAPHLEVTGMEAVGAAAGMRLAWNGTNDGARFVLYSEGSAGIPAVPPLPSSGHVPILRIEAKLRTTGAPPPRRIEMRAIDLLGADANGQGVDVCPIYTFVEPFDAYTVFCSEVACDFDGNGTSDVRDLVHMVNCLTDTTRCDLRRADCDGDGGFDLEDVLCCAHVILRGDRPDTTGGRPDPSLEARFGAPVEDAGTLGIPITLEGANAVAGARLVFRYPSDRFDVVGVDFPGRSSWLELHEVAAGRVVVGMIDLGGLSPASFHRTFTLRVALKAGQRPGGDIVVETAEFSDPHGVALISGIEGSSITLGGRGLELGPARPNPFGREMRFALTLAEPTTLEVSIHDLGGRLVTTLHRGQASAGGHTFRWDGRDAGGKRAADGIYFYRAQAAGQTLARKVILLRER